MPPRASSMPQPWPAVSPDQTNEIERRSARRGAETADDRLAHDGRRRKILKADAVEDVLPGRQAFDQSLGGEVAFRQRIDERAVPDVLEAVGGRDLDQHARRTVGARPDHAGVDRDVAGLHTMRDQRPVGGAAEIGLGDRSDRRNGRCGGRTYQEPAAVHAVSKADCHLCLHLTGRKVSWRDDNTSAIMATSM